LVPPTGRVVLGASCLSFPEFCELSARRMIVAAAEQTNLSITNHDQVVPFAFQHRAEGTDVCLTWHGVVEEFAVPRITSGMAGNVALAAATALALGVGSNDIRERLPRWRLAPLRGEVRNEGGRLVYLDCYNANPVSMRDALAGFVALAPESEPRLFVFGCMEELGKSAEVLHRELGERWPMRAQDSVIVLGSNATAFAEGMKSQVANATIVTNPDSSQAERMVREFAGPVFLKGSRRYALEKLLGVDGHSTQANTEVAA